MELSTFIAQIIAVIYLTASLGGFFSQEYYRRVVDDLYGNAGLSFLWGFVAVITGMLIVHYHNLWVGDWRILITLVGWVALIKGAFIIVMPERMRRISRPFVTAESMKFFPYIALAMGLLFAWVGFATK